MPDLLTNFQHDACHNLDYSRDRMLHCIEQLSEEDLWWRPRPDMNAVANIVLHVCGNMTQWIIVGCDKSQALPDQRDRPGEFAARGGHDKQQLTARLRDTVERAKATIRSLDEDDLLRSRFIQIGETTAMGAVWHSVAHLEGHAQEVIYATRLRLGDAYRFKNVY